MLGSQIWLMWVIKPPHSEFIYYEQIYLKPANPKILAKCYVSRLLMWIQMEQDRGRTWWRVNLLNSKLKESQDTETMKRTAVESSNPIRNQGAYVLRRNGKKYRNQVRTISRMQRSSGEIWGSELRDEQWAQQKLNENTEDLTNVHKSLTFFNIFRILTKAFSTLCSCWPKGEYLCILEIKTFLLNIKQNKNSISHIYPDISNSHVSLKKSPKKENKLASLLTPPSHIFRVTPIPFSSSW